MNPSDPMVPISEMRFAVTVADLDAALRLYRDLFGLEVREEWDNEGARGVVLEVPSATLALFNIEQGYTVDEIEVGRRLGERIRIAVGVNNVTEAADGALAAGATPMAPPVETPWGDFNHRFKTRDGMQLTLFQSPGAAEFTD